MKTLDRNFHLITMEIPRRRRRLKMTTPGYLFLFFISITLTQAKVGVMHYGSFGGLSITCQRDELILMESQNLGYSQNDDCAPQSMCSVPYTLAKWYCRGKSTCAGMQVERRPLHKRTCGSDFTNCLRVEYSCVKRSQLTDVCSDSFYQVTEGYIASPSFPEMYPPDQNCTCVISSAEDDRIQVETAFFLLKASQPCKDWVDIAVDNQPTKKTCGYNPEQNSYMGKHIKVNFVSDALHQEMGFWIKFKSASNTPTTVRCGRYATEEVTTTMRPTAPPPTQDQGWRMNSEQPFEEVHNNIVFDPDEIIGADGHKLTSAEIENILSQDMYYYDNYDYYNDELYQEYLDLGKGMAYETGQDKEELRVMGNKETVVQQIDEKDPRKVWNNRKDAPAEANRWDTVNVDSDGLLEATDAKNIDANAWEGKSEGKVDVNAWETPKNNNPNAWEAPREKNTNTNDWNTLNEQNSNRNAWVKPLAKSNNANAWEPLDQNAETNSNAWETPSKNNIDTWVAPTETNTNVNDWGTPEENIEVNALKGSDSNILQPNNNPWGAFGAKERGLSAWQKTGHATANSNAWDTRNQNQIPEAKQAPTNTWEATDLQNPQANDWESFDARGQLNTWSDTDLTSDGMNSWDEIYSDEAELEEVIPVSEKGWASAEQTPFPRIDAPGINSGLNTKDNHEASHLGRPSFKPPTNNQNPPKTQEDMRVFKSPSWNTNYAKTFPPAKATTPITTTTTTTAPTTPIPTTVQSTTTAEVTKPANIDPRSPFQFWPHAHNREFPNFFPKHITQQWASQNEVRSSPSTQAPTTTQTPPAESTAYTMPWLKVAEEQFAKESQEEERPETYYYYNDQSNTKKEPWASNVLLEDATSTDYPEGYEDIVYGDIPETLQDDEQNLLLKPSPSSIPVYMPQPGLNQAWEPIPMVPMAPIESTAQSFMRSFFPTKTTASTTTTTTTEATTTTTVPTTTPTTTTSTTTTPPTTTTTTTTTTAPMPTTSTTTRATTRATSPEPPPFLFHQPAAQRQPVEADILLPEADPISAEDLNNVPFVLVTAKNDEVLLNDVAPLAKTPKPTIGGSIHKVAEHGIMVNSRVPTRHIDHANVMVVDEHPDNTLINNEEPSENAVQGVVETNKNDMITGQIYSVKDQLSLVDDSLNVQLGTEAPKDVEDYITKTVAINTEPQDVSPYTSTTKIFEVVDIQAPPSPTLILNNDDAQPEASDTSTTEQIPIHKLNITELRTLYKQLYSDDLFPLDNLDGSENDPQLYKKIQELLEKKQAAMGSAPVAGTEQAIGEGTTVAANKPKGAAAVSSSNKSSSGSMLTKMGNNTMYVLVVIAVVGWVIFVVMVGLLIHYKRDTMCGRRRLEKKAHFRSGIPQHMLFPHFHTPPSTYSDTPPALKHSPHYLTNANLSTQTSSFLDLAKLLHATERRARRHHHHPHHHPLEGSDSDTLSSVSGSGPPHLPLTPISSTLESASTQTSFGENVCTQTDKSSATQTYDTLKKRYYESLGKAMGLKKAAAAEKHLIKNNPCAPKCVASPLPPPVPHKMDPDLPVMSANASLRNPPHPYTQTSTPFTGGSSVSNSQQPSPENAPKWAAGPGRKQRSVEADDIYQSLNKLADKYGVPPILPEHPHPPQSHPNPPPSHSPPPQPSTYNDSSPTPLNDFTVETRDFIKLSPPCPPKDYTIPEAPPLPTEDDSDEACPPAPPKDYSPPPPPKDYNAPGPSTAPSPPPFAYPPPTHAPPPPPPLPSTSQSGLAPMREPQPGSSQQDGGHQETGSTDTFIRNDEEKDNCVEDVLLNNLTSLPNEENNKSTKTNGDSPKAGGSGDGNSTERLKRLIPPRAKQFNETVQPELSRVFEELEKRRKPSVDV